MNTTHRQYQPTGSATILIALLAILILITSPASGDEKTDFRVIHERLLTLDSHIDIARKYMLQPEFDPGKPTTMKVDLEKMEKGGLDAGFFIVFVEQGPRTPAGYAAALEATEIKLSAIHAMADTYTDRIVLAYSPEDVRKIVAEGKKAAIIGIENGFVLAKKLGLLNEYYARGVRYLGLTHSGNNGLCGSSSLSKKLGDKVSDNPGVSPFGQQVISRMNRLGMMVDISHASDACMWQAIELSSAPIIASHSGVRSMAASSRNLSDAQMLALAESGGVMQLVAYTGFIKPDPARNKAFSALEERVRIKYKASEFSYKLHEHTPEYQAGVSKINCEYPLASVADFIDQVEYAIQVMGIDHVGISSDFDGGGELDGWSNAAESFNITKELLSRGLSETDIGKIWSGNLLRVWSEVEKTAAVIKKTYLE